MRLLFLLPLMVACSSSTTGAGSPDGDSDVDAIAPDAMPVNASGESSGRRIEPNDADAGAVIESDGGAIVDAAPQCEPMTEDVIETNDAGESRTVRLETVASSCAAGASVLLCSVECAPSCYSWHAAIDGWRAICCC